MLSLPQWPQLIGKGTRESNHCPIVPAPEDRSELLCRLYENEEVYYAVV